MIANERQYKITKRQLARLIKSINKFNIKKETKRIRSNILARAEFDALKSEMEVLTGQIKKYEKLKSGKVKNFKAKTLNELPRILIQARIARGLTQRKFADKLHLKEQQIQRYEAEEYASASFERLIKIADALNLNVSENAKLEYSEK